MKPPHNQGFMNETCEVSFIVSHQVILLKQQARDRLLIVNSLAEGPHHNQSQSLLPCPLTFRCLALRVFLWDISVSAYKLIEEPEPTHWKRLMLGKTEGKRRRGQQRMRWLDSNTD